METACYERMEIDRTKFDPEWRDDIFDQEALDFPLVLPDSMPPVGKVWVMSRMESQVRVFGEIYPDARSRMVTAMVKRSDKVDFYTVRNQDGEVVAKDNPILNFMFPPKAWMSDGAEERPSFWIPGRTVTRDSSRMSII